MRKYFRSVLILVSALFANFVIGQEMEEVVVTSSFTDQLISEIADPLHIVSGDAIGNFSTQSLGEALDNLLGVGSADYGTAVGQPVIRGLSGGRVKVLNNSMVVRDVSGLGADHSQAIDMNNIQQIEVVRGPASLLYANGGVGGVVNIVDNTIAREDFTGPELKLGVEGQSVNGGDTRNLSYQNNVEFLGDMNFTFSHKKSEFGNYDVPLKSIIHAEEEEHEGEEEDHHEEDLDYLKNSDYESESNRIGFSWVEDWGYVGFSASNIESVYGIPFHAEVHHDEDEEEEEEHEDERIFSTTKSDVINIEGAFNFNNNFIQQMDYYFRNSDYKLTEAHAEVHHDEDEEEEEEEEHHAGPTKFTNDAKEYGAIFDLSNDLMTQKVVMRFVEEDTSIIGKEVFMQPAQNTENSFGYYASREIGGFELDAGFRVDQINRKGSIKAHEHEEEEEEEEEHHDESTAYDKDYDGSSLAFSIGRQLNDMWHISLGVAGVERAPSAVELFMNGPHLATSRFEEGNTNLRAEKSTNLDLTVNVENDYFYGTLSFYNNNVDNYIYLLDSTKKEEGLLVANYLQRDAEISGYELEIGKSFEIGSGLVDVSFGRDDISGKFSNGAYIPRMMPSRYLYSLSYYSQNNLEWSVDVKDVDRVTNLAQNETASNGFQLLGAQLTKTFDVVGSNGQFAVTIFGHNLLDEIARNHTSFVKDQVPLPGRNLGVKFNYSF
ncbi:MAG: TonB-dependent receptor [Rhodospirillaceae bacterium]|nr:TonB-dependent receptor [Rhodospirillaceae bacterium]